MQMLFVRSSALFLLLSSFVPIAASTSLESCGPLYRNNVIKSSQDIGHAHDLTLDDCCDYCKQTPNCHGYSYSPHFNGTCHLKAKPYPIVYRPGITSGAFDEFEEAEPATLLDKSICEELKCHKDAICKLKDDEHVCLCRKGYLDFAPEAPGKLCLRDTLDTVAKPTDSCETELGINIEMGKMGSIEDIMYECQQIDGIMTLVPKKCILSSEILLSPGEYGITRDHQFKVECDMDKWGLTVKACVFGEKEYENGDVWMDNDKRMMYQCLIPNDHTRPQGAVIQAIHCYDMHGKEMMDLEDWEESETVELFTDAIYQTKTLTLQCQLSQKRIVVKECEWGEFLKQDGKMKSSSYSSMHAGCYGIVPGFMLYKCPVEIHHDAEAMNLDEGMEEYSRQRMARMYPELIECPILTEWPESGKHTEWKPPADSVWLGDEDDQAAEASDATKAKTEKPLMSEEKAMDLLRQMHADDPPPSPPILNNHPLPLENWPIDEKQRFEMEGEPVCYRRANRWIEEERSAFALNQEESECCHLCYINPGCKAYTWRSVNNGTCFFISHLSPIQYKVGSYLGILNINDHGSCEQNNKCSEYADCVESRGGEYACMCAPGTRDLSSVKNYLEGRVCEKPKESDCILSEGLTRLICGPDSYCLRVGNGGIECACKVGFMDGDPVTPGRICIAPAEDVMIVENHE